MSLNSTYGTVKPSMIKIPQDVEMWYQYKPKRSNTDDVYTKFRKVDNVADYFEQAEINENLFQDL